MRNTFFILLGFGLLLAAILFFGTPNKSYTFDDAEGDSDKGAYLVRLAGCVSCHTRPNGGLFLAGGGPIETPFGIFYGPNITPDLDDGIGDWSLEAFSDALVNGHSKTKGPLYPVFPFTSYSKMKPQDIADLWAYVSKVDVQTGSPPPHDLNSPFIQRVLLRPWKTLFLKPGEIEDDPEMSPTWNRGRYIVEGLGHCTECHTPRSRFGAPDNSRALEGSVLTKENEKVPAITALALGKRGYDKGGLMMAFKYGLTPDGDVLGGSMGEVLSDQLQHLTTEDLDAIAAYLLADPL
jgi:mono/diheme cytochrome c family protein